MYFGLQMTDDSTQRHAENQYKVIADKARESILALFISEIYLEKRE
jgi:hypothetical protein